MPVCLEVHRIEFSAYYVAMDRVFDISADVRCAEHAFIVGLIFCEQQRDISFAVEEAVAQLGASGRYDAASRFPSAHLFQDRFRRTRPPGPGVAKPESGQNMESGGLRAAIHYSDLDQDILRRVFGVFHKHVKVAVAIEDAGLQQFILHLMPAALLTRSDQIIVRKTCWGYLYKYFM